ncbi:MAG: hypothetical protein ACFFFC_14325 [Candidatus Thorarchaeota archaeon]
MLFISILLVSIGILNQIVQNIDLTLSSIWGVFVLVVWGFYYIGDNLKGHNIVLGPDDWF